MAELDVTQAFTGKRLLFTGSTGFVGKVALSMLLHHYGDALEQVYVLVRKGSAVSAERRFFDKIITGEPFQPIRDTRGGEQGALEFFKKKCTVLDGDISDPLLGLTEETVQSLTGKVDAVLNSAGLVSFNPSLEVSLAVNTQGVKHAVELCLRWDVPIIHISTSFVAGNRSGLVFEDEEVKGYFPKKEEMDGRDFSLEQELEDCAKIVARLRQQADDKALTSTFRQKALDRLEAEGRDATDEKTLRLAVGRERKLWLAGELTRAGMERAAHWGWPNTYTYTKSLGEQVMAGTPGLRYAIARPSVVESSQKYPFPGWNEGFTTSAPLAFAALKGAQGQLSGEGIILDVIPVDHVVGATIAITAHMLTEEAKRERRVFQMASGDLNPFYATRSLELTGLYRRRYYRNKKSGNETLNHLRSRLEPQPLTRTLYELKGFPMFARGAKFLREGIEKTEPKWGAPTVSALLERAKGKLSEIEEETGSVAHLSELFVPFVHDNRYIFRCDNTRSVVHRMTPADRANLPWSPETLDWRDYWLNVHIPGLEKYVFPGLEEETRRKKVVSAHRDLLELLDASVHAYRHRVAFRMTATDTGQKLAGGALVPAEERYTYGEVQRFSSRVGSWLLANGIEAGDRVLLLSENRPEWGISYFGILRAGATAVPVDASITPNEVANIARRAEAKVILISEQSLEEMPGLHAALTAAGLIVRIVMIAEAMVGDETKPDGIGEVRKSAAADDVASLIFTSGTTGNPKGVMLTHRNFASLVAKLAGVFDIGVGDGLLSVLPLHHTFEFSCGFLLPFSRGAEVTYINELTADKLGEVFETGRVTAMIGVPALWQLLHRRITQEMTARPVFVQETIRALMSTNAELRNRTDINLGKLLFWPVHRKFGGRIKFLVSGGSALPEEVHKAFHSLGFNITEGYGLTEAAPVLAVSDPGNKRTIGTVGRALPGIELKISNPDAEGIGEVIARGPNVMAGYFADRESTDAVLVEGWLRTGDLGRLDEEGRLYLVGRQKDVIIDANGKNVYPDELEDLYSPHHAIKELSIVGLPDEAGGEKVACLCVPEYEGRSRDEVRREIEEHFRKASLELPFYRRVKVLRFTDAELERTSSRKVKRKKVVEELQRIERAAQQGEKVRQTAAATAGVGGVESWLYPLLSNVLNKPASMIRPDARLSVDLGVDSLMMTELSVALEQAGVPLPAINDLSSIQTVDDLRKLVASSGRRPAAETRAREITREVVAKEEEIPVPAPLASMGRQLISFGQKVLFGGVFDVKVTGRDFVPLNRNFLVIANHSSHLDMGLIKTHLGEQGERLVTLAARDYFFDTPLKRAYFENLTNLIPMDRHGSLRESLRLATESLRQGFNLLIFPEGTRSTTGELLEFKPTTGYLALSAGVDILPLYLKGAYEALPKGTVFPKQKELEVRIGPPLTIEMLRAQVKGMAKSEGYRHVTSLAEQAVRALKEGKVLSVPPPPPPTARSKHARGEA